MKQFLFALLASLPVAAWAQGTTPGRANPDKPADFSQTLLNPVNRRLLRLPANTFLYRHLRDTLGNHFTRPLPPGDWYLAVARAAGSHWVAVRWAPGSFQHAGGDTATYYMPSSALKGAQTMIEL